MMEFWEECRGVRVEDHAEAARVFGRSRPGLRNSSLAKRSADRAAGGGGVGGRACGRNEGGDVGRRREGGLARWVWVIKD